MIHPCVRRASEEDFVLWLEPLVFAVSSIRTRRVIIAAYPNSITPPPGLISPKNPLQLLEEALFDLIPSGAGLHLLPFYPSDGDDGFAPRDWFGIEPTFGSLSDVRGIARRWPMVIDGIYNHVGASHKWVQAAMHGQNEGRLAAHVGVNPAQSLVSQRGLQVFVERRIRGVDTYFRHTFGAESFDLNLDHPGVRAEVRRHLDHILELGAQGVRLDAAAYYGRPVSGKLAHHSDANRHVRHIAEESRLRGLRVYAQLNADRSGLSYREQGKDLWLTDFRLPALISLCIIGTSPRPLVSHLKRTWKLPNLLRPLRTHDGILLHGVGWDDKFVHYCASKFREVGLPIRYVGRKPYELNASFPEIASRGVPTASMKKRIHAALVLALLLPGVPYLYLPALFSWHPEFLAPDVADYGGKEPRATNRRPMPWQYAQHFVASDLGSRTRKILSEMAYLRHSSHLDVAHEDEGIGLVGGVIWIKRASSVIGAINLASRPVTLSEIRTFPGRRLDLGPYDWRVWRYGQLVASSG
ncbi:alpha-amylase family glycosyl hydrolase [Micromonospora sp. CPCC 205558]|uniref:alpha-amylase family glycosyl hydrolase n=1 Tax=Micromonospora sp. CPCC 205558 TaxID=3122403 RepID=UPI003FA5F271